MVLVIGCAIVGASIGFLTTALARKNPAYARYRTNGGVTGYTVGGICGILAYIGLKFLVICTDFEVKLYWRMMTAFPRFIFTGEI